MVVGSGKGLSLSECGSRPFFGTVDVIETGRTLAALSFPTGSKETDDERRLSPLSPGCSGNL
jgi:hypothetical protein